MSGNGKGAVFAEAVRKVVCHVFREPIRRLVILEPSRNRQGRSSLREARDYIQRVGAVSLIIGAWRLCEAGPKIPCLHHSGIFADCYENNLSRLGSGRLFRDGGFFGGFL